MKRASIETQNKSLSQTSSTVELTADQLPQVRSIKLSIRRFTQKELPHLPTIYTLDRPIPVSSTLRGMQFVGSALCSTKRHLSNMILYGRPIYMEVMGFLPCDTVVTYAEVSGVVKLKMKEFISRCDKLY